MSIGLITEQRFRFIASGMVTLFLVIIITRSYRMISTSSDHLLWGIPVIAVSLLDIYFLTSSLLREPKNIDTRLSTLVISLGATFGFSLVAVSIADPQFEFAHVAVLQQMGRVLTLVPYPFVLWALFCLKDCLTVVPEAHTVIAHGIYQYSRHPLYVCYIIWAIANSMIFPSLSMMIGSISQIIFLLVRWQREEQLLCATFPEYREYCKRTGLCGTRYKGAVPMIK